MDTLAFSGLVDAVGGVVADVDVDVVVEQPDGTEVVVVPAGKGRTLQGPQAAAYATYLAPGEPEEARMARFAQVLRLVVAKLPQDASKVEAIFTGLGASSRATVPTAQIAAFFLRLNADVLADDVVYRNLPVKAIQDGGTPTSYTVDPEANAAMVAELFPDAARKPGPNSKVRVLVQNGVGSPGLNAQARQQILDAGYTFVNGGNAATLGQTTTAIVVPDTTPELAEVGCRHRGGAQRAGHGRAGGHDGPERGRRDRRARRRLQAHLLAAAACRSRRSEPRLTRERMGPPVGLRWDARDGPTGPRPRTDL